MMFLVVLVVFAFLVVLVVLGRVILGHSLPIPLILYQIWWFLVVFVVLLVLLVLVVLVVSHRIPKEPAFHCFL
jgi:hypothetical protein